MTYQSAPAARASVYRELIPFGVSVKDLAEIPADVMDALAARYETPTTIVNIRSHAPADELVAAVRQAARDDRRTGGDAGRVPA